MYGFLELEDRDGGAVLLPLDRVGIISAVGEGCEIALRSPVEADLPVANHIDQIREQLRQAALAALPAS